MLKRETTGDAPHFVIVQNWLAELARRCVKLGARA
jgi:hypothetical protein